MARGMPLALLLLAAGLLAVQGADPKPTMLGDWLPQTKASVSTYPDYYGYPAENAYSCMRIASWDDFDIVGLLAALYVETGMDCSSSNSHYSEGMFTPMSNRIGKCAWRKELFLIRVFFGDAFDSQEPMRIGSFNLQCDLLPGAKECGDGLCDDTILEASGPLYYVPNAAVKVPIVYPDITGIFQKLEGLESLQAAQRTTNETLAGFPVPDYSVLVPKSPSSSKKTAKKAADGTTQGTPEMSECEWGWGIVATGPVRVSSRHTKVEYEEGYMQAVILAGKYSDECECTGGRRECSRRFLGGGGGGQCGPVTPDSTQYVLDPFRFDLKLKKEKEHHYKHKN